MKKVFILPLNTDLNRGDQALVWESARLIQDLYSDDKVEISLIESGVSASEREAQSAQTKQLGFHFFSPILEHPSRYFVRESHKTIGISVIRLIKWGIVAAFDYMRTRPLLSRCSLVRRFFEIFLSKNKKSTLNALRDADAVFVKGGGFVHSYGKISDGYQMYFSIYTILLALRLKKPVSILPNSFGPLQNRYARRLATRMLQGCQFVSTRENISHEFLNTLGINNYLSPDLGYYLSTPQNYVAPFQLLDQIDTSRKILGMTVRPWRFPTSTSPGETYRRYIHELSTFIHTVTANNWHVILFAHTLGPSAHEDDRLAIRDIMEQLNKSTSHVSVMENQSLTCIDMMELYGKCHAFIGTRFHSVIFAQNKFVPTIAISYGGNKGTGIMRDLGLEKFSIPIDEVSSAKLLAMLNILEQERNTVIQRIKDFKIRTNQKRIELLHKLQQYK